MTINLGICTIYLPLYVVHWDDVLLDGSLVKGHHRIVEAACGEDAVERVKEILTPSGWIQIARNFRVRLKIPTWKNAMRERGMDHTGCDVNIWRGKLPPEANVVAMFQIRHSDPPFQIIRS